MREEDMKMANFNYRRFFIILRAKDTGFDRQEKEPSGYCKVDIKNNRIKFLIYIQDLKPQTVEQGIYEAYIVFPKEEKPAKKLADIFVDNRGRVECTVESDTEALNHTVKSLEQFSAIAIVYRSLAHTDKLYFPLVGSAGKYGEIDWSVRIMADILKTSKTVANERRIPNQITKPSDEATKEQVTVSYKEETQDVTAIPTKSISVEGKAVNHENIFLNNDLTTDRDIEKYKDTEISGILTNQTACGCVSDELGLELGARYEENSTKYEGDFFDGITDEKYFFSDAVAVEKIDLPDETVCEVSFIFGISDSNEISVEKIETHDRIALKDDENPDDKTDKVECSPFSSTNYWDVMRDYFMKLFKENPRAYPFGHNDDRKWVKVEHIPDGYSRYCNQRASADYYVTDPLRRDTENPTHYLVGFVGQDENTSLVIYGFPGYSYEQPPAYAIHGLSVWEPLRNGYGKGYWLIYIDVQTGDIVHSQ